MKSIAILIIVILTLMMSGCFEPPPLITNQIYIYPQVSYKYLDDVFNVSIRCDAVDYICGFETSFRFNQTICQVLNWEWVGYFPSESTFYGIPKIDNINGTITNIYAVSLSGGIRISSAIIRFTFISDNNGICELELYDTSITNTTIDLPVEITNGSIIISG